MWQVLSVSWIWALAVTYQSSTATGTSSCPWDNPDLEKWSQGSTWPSGKIPEENDILVIPSGKKILLDTPIPRLLSLTIDGVLVWDNVDGIRMETSYILINGEFHIGSEECNFEKEADIFLYGKSNSEEMLPLFGRKFVGAAMNSTVEIHGKQKRSWTKLVATVQPECPPLYDSDNEDTRKRNGFWMNIWDSNGDSLSFDKLKTDGPKAEIWIASFVQKIKNIPDGKMVAIAVYKTIGASVELFNELYLAIEALGGSLIRHVGEYEPYVLLAETGKPDCAVERLTRRPAGVRDGIEAEAIFAQGNLAFKARSYSEKILNKDKVRFQVMSRDAAYPKLSFLHDVSSWQPGDEVVVVSTDFDWRQAEVKTIVSCRECQPNQIRVDGGFRYTHFGEVTYGVDERGEVGLLSRNIRIESELQDRCYNYTDHEKYLCGKFGRDTFGGHVKMLEGSWARIEGVQLTHMGQQSELGSYPLHFHLCNEVRGQYLRNNVVRDSNSRCITIHGSYYLEVSDNVCFNHLGHGIFLEDSVEQFNSIRRNLVVGTMHGTLLFSDMDPDWCERRSICGGLSSYWITHPNNYFTDNVAAGSDASGMVLSFADRPLGPSLERSKEQGRYFDKSTRYMRVPEFARNVMHSNKESGLWFDSRISSGEINMNMYIPENGVLGIAMYSPRNPPVPTGRLVESVLTDLTMYKNEDRNSWVRCGNIVITNSSFADSPASYVASHTMDGTYCDVRNSIFIGETDNTGEPFTYTFSDKRFRNLRKPQRPHHHFDRSIAQARPDFLMSAVQFYQGPMYIGNCYFDRYENWYYNDSFIDAWGFRPVRPAAAFTFHPNNHYPMVPRNGVSNLKFGFCDGKNDAFRVMDGNASTSGWHDLDGTGNTMFRDYDGSLTGTPNTQIVQDRPFFTGSKCLKKPDWGLAICPYKYFWLVVRGKTGPLKGKFKGKHPVLISRDDHHDDVYNQTGKTSHKFNVRVFKSYTVWFNPTLGPAPRDIQFRPRFGLENNETIRLAVCLPKSTTNFTIYSKEPQLNPKKGLLPLFVDSLKQLDRDETTTAFFWDKTNGYLYFKMRSPHSMTRPGQECPGDVCLEVNIKRNDGDNEPAVCDTPPTPWVRKDHIPRVKRSGCKEPGSPEGLGAPIEAGFEPPSNSGEMCT